LALNWRGLATHSFVRASLKVAATEYRFCPRKSLTTCLLHEFEEVN